jgi:DNA (cytosine-5)-methyltransferase 1
VQPYAAPALAAIDLTKPGKRIGDRKRPLAPATRARVEAGLVKHVRPLAYGERPMPGGRGLRTPPGAFAAPLRSGRPRTLDPNTDPLATIVSDGGNHAYVEPQLVPVGGSWRTASTPVSQPMPTRTTTENDALLIPVEGRDGVVARPVTAPMRGQTTRLQDALLVPLRNNGVARPVQQPMLTFAAGGTHQALVMRNNTARGNDGQMTTPITEPLRTLTTAGHQSLVQVEDHALYGYDTGELRPLLAPLPTQTTVEGDALVRLSIDVDDCLLRMLDVDEIRAGMAFHPGYLLLGRSNRENVKMLGNAVTPNAARDLVACVVEAITGTEYELAN